MTSGNVEISNVREIEREIGDEAGVWRKEEERKAGNVRSGY